MCQVCAKETKVPPTFAMMDSDSTLAYTLDKMTEMAKKRLENLKISDYSNQMMVRRVIGFINYVCEISCSALKLI